jgi:hypothetical protein
MLGTLAKREAKKVQHQIWQRTEVGLRSDRVTPVVVIYPFQSRTIQMTTMAM